MAVGGVAIVWGAETFAEHLADASKRLGITAFALAILLAGSEPEELATVITASMRDVGGVAFGDAGLLHVPLVIVLVLLGIAVTLAARGGRLDRRDAVALFAGYQSS